MACVARHLRWIPFLIFASALLIPTVAKGFMLGGADVVSIFHYQRIVIADAFREGRLPIWDPHVMAGFPMLAEPQSAVFYPPTWLCVILPAAVFWTLSVWMHLMLAGLFAQRWMERGLGLNVWPATAGALVYMMSGYLAGHIFAGHVNYVWAYPWIPAVLWRLERHLAAPTLKRGILLAGGLALLFLAGVPQYVFFAALLVAARLLHFVLLQVEGRKARLLQALRSVGWLLLGLAFCGPQLFPTLELVGEMHRGGNVDSFYKLDYSLEPAQLGGLVFPPRKTTEPWWETCGYVGGAVLLLTLAIYLGRHPQRYLWASVAALAVLLALGESVPFYKGFAMVVPGAGWFRGPGRYLLMFTLAMAGLAAIGFDVLWNRGSKGYRIAGGVLSAAAVLQLLLFAAPCFVALPIEMRMPSGRRNDLLSICGLEGRVSSGTPLPSFIGQCQAEGIDHTGGYEPMMLRRYSELMNAARGAAPEANMVILAAVAPHSVIRMLSTRVWLLRNRHGGEVLQAFEDPLPRAWLVNNGVLIEEPGERLKMLGSGRWDPGRTVILESLPKFAPPEPTEKPAGTAKILSRHPGFYEIEAECDAPAFLVLSEAYYPGWSVTIDGKSDGDIEVLPADHLIQAVWMPKGKHVVRFEYHSRFLPLGFAVMLAAAAVPVWMRFRRRPACGPEPDQAR